MKNEFEIGDILYIFEKNSQACFSILIITEIARFNDLITNYKYNFLYHKTSYYLNRSYTGLLNFDNSDSGTYYEK